MIGPRGNARTVAISSVPSFISSALESAGGGRKARIGIVASVNLGPFELCLKKYAAASGVDLEVVSGGYDNPIEDARDMVRAELDFAVFVPFIDNFSPALSATFDVLSAEERDDIVEGFVSRWELAARALPASVELIVLLPHRDGSGAAIGPQVDLPTWHASIVERLVASIRSARPVALVDVGRVVSRLGESAALDRRLYFRGKSPFSVAAVDELARLTWLQSREFGSRYNKVLVLDCDNTLWGGVVGEDGVAGIALDPHDYPGNVYWHVQQRIRFLQHHGVLLCLATKNEPADVDAVFASHTSMVLRAGDFVATSVGWTDKPSMIRGLAAELNVGIDSFVFLDDSSFECEAVSSQLPEVVVVQVPSRLPDYPAVIEEVVEHFAAVLSPGTGSGRTAEYESRRASLAERASYGSHEEYLASLDIVLRVVRNESSRMQRLSELTMKTNQFNLTTLRLTEQELSSMVGEGTHEVWSFHVADRFGDHGLVGLALVARHGAAAEIANLLLSCRVLGRGIESAALAEICGRLEDGGAEQISGRFVPSARNQQTADLYGRHGFEMARADAAGSTWVRRTGAAPLEAPAWITVRVDD